MAITASERPGPVDAYRNLEKYKPFIIEWETGNISSTHRALNKMAVGLLEKVISGGLLILPSRELYKFLTDRVGNFDEIKPYFPVWKNLPLAEGVLAIAVIEYDNTSDNVPQIPKGKDGNAPK